MLHKRNTPTSVCSASSSTGKASFLRARSMAVTFGVTIALVSLAVGSPAKAAEDGAALFKTNCVVCHGADGTGTPTGKALKAPDLHSDAVQKLTDAEIATQIEKGKNNMPPFPALKPEEVKALVAYVRTFKKK